MDLNKKMYLASSSLPDWDDEKIDEFQGGRGLSKIGKSDRDRFNLFEWLGSLMQGKSNNKAKMYYPKGSDIGYTIEVTPKGKYIYNGIEFDTEGEAEGYIERMVSERGY